MTKSLLKNCFFISELFIKQLYWPLLSALSALMFTFGSVLYMHGYSGGQFLSNLGFFLSLFMFLIKDLAVISYYFNNGIFSKNFIIRVMIICSLAFLCDSDIVKFIWFKIFVNQSLNNLLYYKLFLFIIISIILLLFSEFTQRTVNFSLFSNRLRIILFCFNLILLVVWKDSVLTLSLYFLDQTYSPIILGVLLSFLILCMPLKSGANIVLTFFQEALCNYALVLTMVYLAFYSEYFTNTCPILFMVIHFFNLFISERAGEDPKTPSKDSPTVDRTWADYFLSSAASVIIKKSVNNLDILKDIPDIQIAPELVGPVNVWYSWGSLQFVNKVLPNNLKNQSLTDFVEERKAQDGVVTTQAYQFVLNNTNQPFDTACYPYLTALKECAFAAGVSSISKSEPVSTLVEDALRRKDPNFASIFLAIKNGNHTASINNQSKQLDDCMKAKAWYTDIYSTKD